MAETQGVVMVYEARDGVEIKLNFDTIRRYLVQGHPEYVTPSEFMYFMGVAKSGGMNPFKRDCWLIKYNQKDNAAIITAIGFLRSRAKAQRDCKGWKTGIIVMRDKQLVYSDGLKLLGDELLGGWARGRPEGWDEDTIIEVNLDGYIKKTREGQVTAFWKPEKQPTQIAKVAESQLLRRLWPDEFQNLYTDAEISPDNETQGLTEIPEETGEEVDAEFDADAHADFDKKVPKDAKPERVKEFLGLVQQSAEKTTFEVKQEAFDHWDEFWASFLKWEGKNYAEDKPEPTDKDPIREEYINLRGAGFSTWVFNNQETIPKMPKHNQEEIKAKWQKLYPEAIYPLDKAENAATDEIATPGGENEDNLGTAQPGAEEGIIDNETDWIDCSHADIAADRIKVTYCEGGCRFREGCKDYEAYLNR